jgi:hypothetical protein
VKPYLHPLPELLAAAAGLLDHLGPVAGLRVGLHTTLATEGVRLLVADGLPYTDDVGPLDRIAAALGAPVVHDRTGPLTHAYVHGTWHGTPAYGSHLYGDRPLEPKPCTHTAAELARRVRALIPWTEQPWTQWAESVHVYDETGTPCIHVVLRSEGSLDDALAALLDATGSLQYRHEPSTTSPRTARCSWTTGTVVTASAVTP